MKFLLVGNYGVGNWGDEALRGFFVQTFPSVEWKVLSAHPRHDEFSRFPAGVRSLLSLSWIRTLQELRASDGMIFGGGSLFTDAESVWACVLWWIHAFVAWLCKKPYYLAFQGVGPFRTRFGAWCAKWAVAHARYVSVRDAQSYDRIRSWKARPQIFQTFDPVFSMFKPDTSVERLQKIVLIPRHNSTPAFRKKAEKIIRTHEGYSVCVLSLQPEDKAEREFARSLNAEVIPVRTIEDLTNGVGDAWLVLSQRFHGSLAAMALGISCESVPQQPGDKLDSLNHAPDVYRLRELINHGIATLEEAFN